MKSLLIVLIFCLVSLNSEADVMDRITACEKKGGGPCVYNILRELASDRKAPVAMNHCKCETAEKYGSENCRISGWENRMYMMRRDGRVISQSKCTFKGEDAAYSACMKARISEVACQ